MKKLVLSFFTFAILITSCNKYANDFQALKDQIAALDLKMSGVTALAGQIATLQSAVGGLATSGSVATLASGLSALSTKVDGLNTIALSIQSNGATTASVTALLAALKTDLNTSISASNTSLTSKIESAIADLTLLQADVTSVKSTVGTSATALATMQNALTALSSATQTKLDILLAAAAMINENITIKSDADVDYWLAKLTQVGIVNGNVTVNTDKISDSQISNLNKVLNNIGAVIGVNIGLAGTTIDGGTSTTGHFEYICNGGGNHCHNVWVVDSITTSGNTIILVPVENEPHFVVILSKESDMLEAKNLVSVAGDYTVAGADVMDTKIALVGGNVDYNYPGGYESTSLKMVGNNLILMSDENTEDINFPIVNLDPENEGTVSSDGVTYTGVVHFDSPLTTSVHFGLSDSPVIHELWTIHAETVTLGTIEPNDLTIAADSASVVDLSAAVSSMDQITVITTVETALHLDNLEESEGDITANLGTSDDDGDSNASTIDLNKFNSDVTINIHGVSTVDKLDSWEAGQLNAWQAKDVTLMKHEWALAPALPVVENLIAANIDNPVHTTVYAYLETLWLNGKAQDHWADCSAGLATEGNAHLTSIKLTGVLNTVVIDGTGTTLGVLETVTTAGQINWFQVVNADAITDGLSIDHANFQGAAGYGGPGSSLAIVDNDELTSLTTTHLDKLLTLVVTGNDNIEHFDFSSFQNWISTGAVTVNIEAYGVKGEFTDGKNVQGETLPVQPIIKSASIYTIKDYLAGIFTEAAKATPTITYASINIDILAPKTGSLTRTLSSAMIANSAPWTTPYVNPIDNMGGIDMASELALVVNAAN